jgi:hypothetical protein
MKRAHEAIVDITNNMESHDDIPNKKAKLEPDDNIFIIEPEIKPDKNIDDEMVEKISNNNPISTYDNYVYFNDGEYKYEWETNKETNLTVIELVFKKINYEKLYSEVIPLLETGYNVIVTTDIKQDSTNVNNDKTIFFPELGSFRLNLEKMLKLRGKISD